MLTVQEMLRTMERLDERGRPQPFSLTLTTCDEKRKKGGKVLKLENVVLAKLAGDKPQPPTPHVRKQKPLGSPAAAPQRGRDTQTRNLYIPLTGETITCHIRLITRFNGQIIID